MPDKKISKSKKRDSIARKEKERIERLNRQLNPKKKERDGLGIIAEDFKRSLRSPEGKYPGGVTAGIDLKKPGFTIRKTFKSGGSVRGVGKAVRGYGKAMSGRK